MKGANKLILSFIILIVTVVIALGQFFQTDMFSRFVSEKINSVIGDKREMVIKFERMGLNYFPPGLEFSEVLIKDKNKAYGSIDASFNKVDISFGIFEILSNRIVISNLSFHNGGISVDIKNNFINSKTKQFSGMKLKKELETFLRKIRDNVSLGKITRVRTINLFDIDVSIQNMGDKLFIKNIYINIAKKATSVQGIIQNRMSKTSSRSSVISIRQIDEIRINVVVEKRVVRSDSIEIISGSKNIKIVGSIFEKMNKKDGVKLALSFRTGLGELCDDFKQLDFCKRHRYEGFIRGKVQIEGDFKNPLVSFSIVGEDLVTEVARVKKVDIRGIINGASLHIQGCNVVMDSGKLNLIDPFLAYDFKKEEIPKLEIKVKADKAKFCDLFHSFQNKFGRLLGEVSGVIAIAYHKGELSVVLGEGLQVEGFKLKGENTNENILTNDLIKFNSALFKLSLVDNNALTMNVDLSFENSRIVAEGYIDKSGINISSNENVIDLEKFGPILGTTLRGTGAIPFNISGKQSDIIMRFKPHVANFSVVGLQLGLVKGIISYNMQTMNLELQMDGSNNKTNYSAAGNIDFKNSLISINSEIKNSNWKDSKTIFADLLPREGPLSSLAIAFDYSAKFRVIGPLDSEKMTVYGGIKGKNLKLRYENAEYIELKFNYRNESLKLSNVVATKRNGKIRGGAFLDFKNSYIEYDLSMRGGHLRDLEAYSLLKLGYNGQVIGTFYGNGTVSDFTSRMNLKVFNGEIGGVRVGDSFLTVYSDSSDYYAKGDVLGGIANFSMNLNMKDPKENSVVKLNVASNDMKVLTGLISEHNMNNNLLSGSLKGSLEASFSIDNWETMNLHAKIDEFVLKNRKYIVEIDNQKNFVNIKNGIIDVWNIAVLSSEETEIKSIGRGSLAKEFSFVSEGSVNALFVELISPLVTGAVGKVGFRSVIKGSTESIVHHLDFQGRNVSFQLNKLPGVIENIDFSISAINDEVYVKYATGAYGQGRLSLDGNAKLMVPFPRINLKLVARNCRLPVGNDSSFVFSANLESKGETVPYKIVGDVVVGYGMIRDPFNEIFKNKVQSVKVSRFIPRRDNQGGSNARVTMDVDLKIKDVISVNNGFVSLGFGGGVLIRGDLNYPLFMGELTVPTRGGKFFFKGHEFNIQEGGVLFDDHKIKRSPTINFTGISKIDKYTVVIKVVGRVDDATILLSSEPLLPKEDILSLLALGVTSDVTKDLHDDDIKSVTSLGVGSLLVDQLKLNQKLNEHLGVKLSVLPEYMEDDTSMLESQKSGKSPLRLRSATKIKIKKKISKKIDVSISSVVGGTMGEKQEMNLNLKISDKVKLQGVYEVKSEEEMDRESSRSVGADLKFRFDF